MSDRATDPDGEQRDEPEDDRVPGALLAVGILVCALLAIAALVIDPPAL